MVKWIGNLTGKKIIKVILSAMTDIADLHGSYEQV
jgi:midasin (ATPase involved in ribosome maturation)